MGKIKIPESKKSEGQLGRESRKGDLNAIWVGPLRTIRHSKTMEGFCSGNQWSPEMLQRLCDKAGWSPKLHSWQERELEKYLAAAKNAPVEIHDTISKNTVTEYFASVDPAKGPNEHKSYKITWDKKGKPHFEWFPIPMSELGQEVFEPVFIPEVCRYARPVLAGVSAPYIQSDVVNHWPPNPNEVWAMNKYLRDRSIAALVAIKKKAMRILRTVPICNQTSQPVNVRSRFTATNNTTPWANRKVEVFFQCEHCRKKIT